VSVRVAADSELFEQRATGMAEAKQRGGLVERLPSASSMVAPSVRTPWGLVS